MSIWTNHNHPQTPSHTTNTNTKNAPEEETEKNLQSASVATALARNDLPVPGGPYSRMPRHGLRFPCT